MDLPIEKLETMNEAEASAFWDKLTQEMMLGEDDAARATLAAGRPVYYSEIDTPEELTIKEYPSGRRELVELFIENGKRGERVVKAL